MLIETIEHIKTKSMSTQRVMSCVSTKGRHPGIQGGGVVGCQEDTNRAESSEKLSSSMIEIP